VETPAAPAHRPGDTSDPSCPHPQYHDLTVPA
jgi:hypothetical protein